MANRLITTQEAAQQLLESIELVIAEAASQGVPDDVVRKGIEDYFAMMGGFPPASDTLTGYDVRVDLAPSQK